MSIIKILPENLINQIAAGEVVERPASVIKELIENSLDAGADQITVEVKNAGKTLIRITDNGCGMSREDCEIALQRHATSKISKESDLWQIHTMGFRGEALPSISSVSKMILRSRTKDDLAGTEIQCEGGEIKIISEVGKNVGTQIEVRDLFFNTPARQKYLKSDSTELSHISSAINTIALAHPKVSFKLIHNDKTVTDLPHCNDLLSRIADIFGQATAEAMLPVFYGASDLKIDGFIGKPVISRSSGQHQYFLVNKRPIQNYILANIVKEAFHSMLMENRRPVFILNIEIDPALIDVNVHPRKLEIRFEDQQKIVKILYGAVKTALDKSVLIPKGFTESQRYMSDSFPKSDNFHGRHSTGPNVVRNTNFPSSGKPASIQDTLNFSREILTQRDFGSIRAAKTEDADTLKAVFQVANSYIVAEGEEGIILIDQHAAHERVRYEALMDQFEKEEKTIQPLLVPLQIELSADEQAIVSENHEIFESLGFEMESFSGQTIVVNAVPGFLAGENLEEVFRGVLDDILNQKGPSKFQGKTEEIINYMACRSAIKFGQALKETEMQALIKQMQNLKRPYTCPHGRPTMIALDLNELGKMFGRK